MAVSPFVYKIYQEDVFVSNTKKAKTDITDNHWSKVSEFGGLWGMQILFACYRVGGRPLFSLFLLPVIAWFYLFKSGARKASVKYLKKIQKISR